MSRFEFKLPDLGEGTIDAEVIEWHVRPGHRVAEDDIIVDVMTDKANIEIPSPVTGTVLETTGEPGDMIAVGSTLIVFETEHAPPAAAVAKPAEPTAPEPPQKPVEAKPIEASAKPDAKPKRGKAKAKSEPAPEPEPAVQPSPPATPESSPGRILASPSVRRRAREAGIDLAEVPATGDGGRITNADYDAYVAQVRPVRKVGATRPAEPSPDEREEIKVIGVRRVIAQRLAEAKRTIPHFAYVEEIDVTELERLRAHLNATRSAELTYLPFIGLALIRVLTEFPQCNAHYDAERGVLVRYRAVHLGVATQTPDGLKVPVVHAAEQLSLWQLADQIRAVSSAARAGSASREQLTGSTITVTSLGRLGGIASTPIINAPEVAIVGVNKAVLRPMVVDGEVVTRLMMNLSSSFDHRFVDGYDAAGLIQALKQRLEHPATIFVD
jgi:2-oxoisovalerate dehydrogenase E2 component (dihydrolipoyl transacylase)